MNLNQLNVERKNRSAFFNGCHKRNVCFLSRIPVLLGCALLNSIFLVDVCCSQQGSPGQEKIKTWISQLSDSDFLVRDSARSNLMKAGGEAFDQLYRARNINDLEARFTIGEILSVIKVHWISGTDSPVVVDLMLDFQQRKVNDRVAVVDRLSWLSAGESLPAIYRIMLFDRSNRVSDHAAARLLEMVFLRDAGPDPRLIAVYKEAASRRFKSLDQLLASDSKWGEKMVATCFAMAYGGQGSLVPFDDFQKPIGIQEKSSQKISAAGPPDVKSVDSRLIANRVIYRLLPLDQDEMLVRLDRVGMALVNQTTDTGNLLMLLESLLENRRLKSISKLYEQLGKVIQGKPAAGFLVAEAFRLAGDQARARQITQDALRVVSKNEDGLEFFIDELIDLGLTYWAADLIRTRVAEETLSVETGTLLAKLELQQMHLGEAERTAKLVLKIAGPDESKTLVVLADIAKAKGTKTEEMRWLQAALKRDPLSPSILVRVHLLSKKTQNFDRDDFRKKVEIAQGAYLDTFREGTELVQSGLPAEENLGKVKMGEAANSLAWLLSNLEQDLPQALEKARLAVDLEPRNPVFLDTLAFCEFKHGNRKLAIQLQRRAVFADQQNREFKLRLEQYVGKN